MFDLISIGDATIDTFIQIHEAQIKCNLNRQDCKLCLAYGDKIPVDKLAHLVAGNAANNAIGSRRLNLKSAIYVNIGDDDAGKKIADKLKEEKVGTEFVKVNANMESNYSAVINFKGERTILIYHQPWKYNLPDLDKTKWVYFTSLSHSFTQSQIIDQLVQYLTRTGAKLLYNPGTYQIEAGVKKSPQLLSLTEVFVVNLEEAEKIVGRSSGKNEVKRLLKDLHDLGPKIVVITDGGNGSYALSNDKYYQLDIFPAHLVEMTGAGDGYAAGFLAAMFYGKEVMEAMRWGAANGASVIEQIGPQAGLLSYDKMQEKLKEYFKIIAKEI